MLKYRRLLFLLAPLAALYLMIVQPGAAVAASEIPVELAIPNTQSFEFVPLVEAEPVTQGYVIADIRDSVTVETAEPVSVRDDFQVVQVAVVGQPLPYYDKISSYFGAREAPCNGCSTMHSGTDFQAPYKTPILAVSNAVVTAAGWNGTLGQEVTITFDNNGQQTSVSYAHLSRIDVSVGQTVKVGDVMGAVGSTGQSTGNHLHLSVRVGGGTLVDSLVWLNSNYNLDSWANLG